MRNWCSVLVVSALGCLSIPASAQNLDGLKAMPRDANGCITAMKEQTGQCWTIRDDKLLINGKPTIVGTKKDLDAKRQPLPAAPAGVARLDAEIPRNLLDSRDNVLPQLFVFDRKTGREVDLSKLPKELAAYLKDDHLTRMTRKEAGKSPLQMAIGRARMADGRTVEDALRASGGKSRYVMVQWWAEWCSPCLQEARDIGALMAKKPMPDVMWITVNNDISQTEQPGART